MAVFPAQQPELTFKISAPDLIDFPDGGQRLSVTWGSVLSLSVRHETFAFENIADSAGCRNRKVDPMIQKPHTQLFRPPVRVFLS